MGTLRKTYDQQGQGVVQGACADRAKQSADAFSIRLRTFFTPCQGLAELRKRKFKGRPAATCDVDDGALADFRRKVCVVNSDGDSGTRRVMFLAAQEYFPSVALVIRDLCHALRIGTQKPLQLETLYGQVYEELVNKGHFLHV